MTTTANEDILAEARRLLAAEQEAIRAADELNPVLPNVRRDAIGAASIVLERFFTKDTVRELAYYRENWYSYYRKLWSLRHTEDVQHFIHKKLIDCRSVDNEGEVLDFNPTQASTKEIQFQIQNLVSIPSHFTAPVALVKGKWEAVDARGKLVCRGEIVDMMTGKASSNHLLFIPNGAEWAYKEKIEMSEHWEKFLRDLFGDKDDEILLLQEWMGYVLSGDTWAQKGMIIVGPPRAGKGIIGHIMTKLLGESMVSSPSLHSLGKDFGLEPLLDKRLCLISDARLSNRVDIMAVIEVLLRVTAGDSIGVGRKHKTSIQEKLDARVMMLSNEMPLLSDNSNAINTRFLILSLQNSFLGREDINLLERLDSDLSAIARWAVEGYRRVRKRGAFVEPLSSKIARDEWYAENNPLEQFLEDRCIVETEGRVELSALFDAYRTWAEARGLPNLAANTLSRRLSVMLQGRIRRGKTSSTRYIYGLSVKQGDF